MWALCLIDARSLTHLLTLVRFAHLRTGSGFGSESGSEYDSEKVSRETYQNFNLGGVL